LQGLEADTVRFPFVIPGIGQLGLDRCRLGGRHGPPGHLGIVTGRQEGQAHGHHGRNGLLLGGGNAPGQVVLGHVGQFVGQYPSQFRLTLGRQQKARIHPHIAPVGGKGVDGGVFHGKKDEAVARVRAGCRQPPPHLIQVGGHFRIVEKAGVLTDLIHHLLANLLFHGRTQLVLGNIPQIRQIIRMKQRRIGQQQGEDQGGKARQTGSTGQGKEHGQKARNEESKVL